MQLFEVSGMASALKSHSTSNVKVLFKLIFEENYDRKSREKLRKFSGFAFEQEGPEFKRKIAKAKNDFSLNELITVANVLQISSEGSANDLVTRIVTSLIDLNVLQSNVIVDSENELSEDDDDKFQNVSGSSKTAYVNDIDEGRQAGQIQLLVTIY